MSNNRFLILLSTVLLSGCSVFSPVQQQNINRYAINAVNQTQFPRQSHLVLQVTNPQTSSVYNTAEMVYIAHPYEISYFSKNAWAETPPHMLAPLMVQSLENTHAFKGVVGPAFSGNIDYVLNTQIISLQQSFLTNPSEIQLVILATLLNNNSHKIVASKTFSIVEPASENTPYGGVVALNRAATKFMQELAVFCVRGT